MPRLVAVLEGLEGYGGPSISTFSTPNPATPPPCWISRGGLQWPSSAGHPPMPSDQVADPEVETLISVSLSRDERVDGLIGDASLMPAHG